MRPWSRRDFLKMTALASAAGLAGLVPRRALADGVPEQRVVFYTSPNGSRIIGGWRPMLNSGQAITSDKLGPILSPLGRYVDQMLLVEGLDLATEHFFPQIPGVRQRGHAARSTLWSGYPLTELPTCQGDDSMGSGPSMDQELARSWGLDPADNHIIKIGKKGSCVFSHTNAHYAGDHSPIMGDFRQEDYFQRIWGDQAAGSGTGRAKVARHMGYELAQRRLNELRQEVSAADQEGFGRHLESLERAVRNLDADQLVCDRPSSPVDPADLNLFRFNYVPFTETWFALIAAAIRCQASRIFGVSWGDEGATGDARHLNSVVRSGDLHPISHEADRDPDAHQVMVDFNRFHAQQLAQFMDLLAAIPEADGTSALDNTLIVWGQPMGEGATHSSRNLPFVLLGGRRTRLRMGYYHNFGNWPSGHKWRAHGGRPHTLLLTTIMHALGLDNVDHVGHPDITDKGNLDNDLLGS